VFKNKCIVVGITGSIAAYKAIDLVSNLKKKGAEVHCVLTKAAQEFVTPLTLRTISQNPVITDLFSEPITWNVAHVGLAEKADLIMVVPATANIIGKVAAGIADDFLSTLIMASKAPLLFAPAMNHKMYQNPLVQRNIAFLQTHGSFFVGPASGALACGTKGQGRLIDTEIIMAQVEALLVPEKPLQGLKILITAGPTREPLDPVRFLSNYSSGKMGYALAKQAYLLGGNVFLISGPTNLKPFPGVHCLQIETALEMHEVVMEHFPDSQIVIKAAAVADFRPLENKTEKIKKGKEVPCLNLTGNPDILLELGKQKQGQTLVGFAAETEQPLVHAQRKVKEKNLDFIVLNDLTQPGAGFGTETNIVTFVFPDGRVEKLPKLSKMEVAQLILAEIIRQRSGLV